METIQCTVSELYDLRSQLTGLYKVNDKFHLGIAVPKEGVEIQIIYQGLLNETEDTDAKYKRPVLTEGAKRIALRILNKIAAEIKIIDQQRRDIETIVGDDDETKALRAEREKELVTVTVQLSIEEKMDFKKIEDLKFTSNYQLLYDKIFN